MQTEQSRSRMTYPRTVDEALRDLAALGNDAVAVAGATLAALTDRLTRRGPARRTVDACHELPDGTTSCRDEHRETGQPS